MIPARDEEALLPVTLSSLRERTPDDLDVEIIVVDNGSEDRTVEVAGGLADAVLERPDITVAGLRNDGVAETTHPVLVFLDADIVVTDEWARNIGSAVAALAEDPMTVTGSRCGVAERATWLERHWFAPVGLPDPRYINSGHLIVTRRLFDLVGGFDATLTTGEDVDFCDRARQEGAEIAARPELVVVHRGFPQSVPAFFRRELWHGVGDMESWRRFVRSKVALTASLFAALHVVLGVGLYSGSVPVASVAGAAIGLIVIGSAAARRSPRGVAGWAATTSLYYVYYWARALSPFFHLMSGRRRR